MQKKDIGEKILVSITGTKESDWQSKLLEIEKLKIKRIALFLEIFSKEQRKKIYSALLSSGVKEISFVHAKNQMNIDEFEFLIKNFKTKYFNIHEYSFNYLKKWKGIHEKLLLELNYDDKIAKNVKINKIRGFCIDLSHFNASNERKSAEYFYVIKRKNLKKYFKANHLNGYSYSRKKDLHTINSLKNFDYLKKLPKFVFGEYIALEVFNSIKEQLKFKKYLIKILKNKI